MLRSRGIPSFGAVCVSLALLAPALVARGDRVDATPREGPATNDPWAVLKLLPGSWEGEIDGKLGTGTGVRHYEFVLRNHFLVSRHSSVRLPQDRTPEGDEHFELGVFSFDSVRNRIMHREFMSEGIVIRSSCTVNGMNVVCVSEAVENGPGIRARLTLEIIDRYRFTEIYEIAWPGRDLEHYFTNRWTRSAVPYQWD